MKRTIEFHSADVSDGNTLVIMLSDGSTFKLTIAQMLKMRSDLFPASDRI